MNNITEKSGVKNKRTLKKVLTAVILIMSAILLILIGILLFTPLRHYETNGDISFSVTYTISYVEVDWYFDDAGKGVYPVPWHKLFTGEIPAERNAELTYRKLTDLELLWDTYELPKTGMTYQSKRDEHYHAHPELYR